MKRALLCWFLACYSAVSAAPVKNVILVIGDGMGFEQVRLGRAYHGSSLDFENFPVKGSATTNNVLNKDTDSAAAGTALATGHKVVNNTVSMEGEQPCPTLLELARDSRKWTGLVTTTQLTDATPACFASHVTNRKEQREIARQMLNEVKPNVLLGGDGKHIFAHEAKAAGYALITDTSELQQFANADFTRRPKVYGGFGSYLWYGWVDHENLPIEIEDREADGRFFSSLRGGRGIPHLHEMAEAAVKMLDQSPDGFFLMIESGNIDTICHSASLFRDERFMPDPAEALAVEVEELGRTVEALMAWAGDREDTLIVVTADHETGGLHIVKEGDPGRPSKVVFTAPHYGPHGRLDDRYHHHTGVPVPVFAWGPGSEVFEGAQDNTDIFRHIQELQQQEA